MARFIDLTGARFGRLKVLSRAPNQEGQAGDSRSAWWCECECGNIESYTQRSLKNRGDRAQCKKCSDPDRDKKKESTIDELNLWYIKSLEEKLEKYRESLLLGRPTML